MVSVLISSGSIPRGLPREVFRFGRSIPRGLPRGSSFIWPGSTPLITAFATSEQQEVNKAKGVSPGRLWAILRKFFDQVADRIDTFKPQFATKLRSATPHWLRHTHASHALEGGADLTTVRDNLRHASLTTTSGYLHVDQARRSRQLGRAFGVALKKPRSIRPSA